MSPSLPIPRSSRTDGEATRARILDAAGALFAAHGFAETTSKAIAAQADVDLASINYHFGSRSGLYKAVLAEAHRRLMDIADLERLAQSPVSASAKLRTLLTHLVRNALDSAQNWHTAVLTTELLAPSSHMQEIFKSDVSAKSAFVTDILSEITGIAKTDPALQRCLISVITPVLWLQIGRRGVPGPVQALLQMPADVLSEHFYHFALAGLERIKGR